ncbi:MAG: hypothetical protein NZ700_10165 [Gemmataceae bacterium]|nr:hypothetical protein [Gemmataceae bacterium]MDW8265662.1 hypothetical protein [Gemmataceae bacterium]
MEFDPERVRANILKADTEDLLDRVTVWRAGMEPEAVAMIEAELQRRGIGAEQIAAHSAQRWATALPMPDGTAVRCSFCDRPAVIQGWGWHRIQGRGLAALLSLLPLYRPRFLAYCAVHRPTTTSTGDRHPPA